MTFLYLLLFALASAGLYAALAAKVTLWALLGVFALGYLAANLILLLLFAINGLLLPKLRADEGIEKQHKLSRWIVANGMHWLVGYSGCRARISGLEKMPDGPFLFVCNHRSMLDPMLVADKLQKYNISFVSKPSNLQIPIAGITARHTGYLAIDRENNREALKTILQAADYLKRGVCNIGIYPEGTRSRTGELLPFHAGSFKIAQKAGVPVVVACVYYPRKRIFLQRKPVCLEILETIGTDRVRSLSTNELADEASGLIRKRLNEVKERI